MKRFAFKKIYHIFFILLVYFIICEIFLRIFWVPFEKQRHRPYLKNPYIDGSRIKYYLDEESDDLKYKWLFGKKIEKPDNTYRIFFIGGSTTEQANLPKEKTSWKIIENSLNKRSKDVRFECINFGTAGAFSSDSVALLAQEIIHYEPDMVVVMHGINDLFGGLLDPKYLAFNKPRDGDNLSFKDILKGLYTKSYLLMFLKRRIYDKLKNTDYQKPFDVLLEEYRLRWRKSPKKTYTVFPSLDSFKRNTKTMIGIAKAHDVRICFLTQPHLYSENMTEDEKNTLWLSIYLDDINPVPDIRTLYRGTNIYNEEVRLICDEHNVECIDLASKIPKDLRYFWDQCHYTPEGARLVAEIVSEYLLNHSQPHRLR